MNTKSPNFEGKNWFKFKLKHREAKKAILSERFGDPGRSVPYPGDSRIIRESWHMWETGNESATKRHFGSQEVEVLI